MGSLTLFTSGSTKEPKNVTHTWQYINECALRSVAEIGLTNHDIVLDVFPSNVIAHYTITALPAQLANATLISANFNPYSYINLFNQHKPTCISLIPHHIAILQNTKGWDTLDMSSVRYMITGSSNIEQSLIDSLLQKGVKTVANWYGMTEMPPPVLVGYNSAAFDIVSTHGYSVEFTDEGECVINGHFTGDIFNLTARTFSHRKESTVNITWKNNTQ